jgi:sortase (surface protein transpeptidase)
MRKILLIVGSFLLVFSIFGIVKPYALEAKTDTETKGVIEAINQIATVAPTETPISSPSPTEAPEVLDEVMEIPTSNPTPKPEPTFNIDWIKKLGLNRNCSEWDYIKIGPIGLVEVPNSNISVSLRYGTYYKSNIDSAAGMTEFSTDERLYILGHNYKDGTIFHNLINTKIGETVVITLVNTDENILNKYTFEVVFTKRYTDDEYAANNHLVLTDNYDYDDEYDLVLATCNHYSKEDKGRQVVLCKLLEEQ